MQIKIRNISQVLEVLPVFRKCMLYTAPSKEAKKSRYSLWSKFESNPARSNILFVAKGQDAYAIVAGVDTYCCLKLKDVEVLSPGKAAFDIAMLEKTVKENKADTIDLHTTGEFAVLSCNGQKTNLHNNAQEYEQEAPEHGIFDGKREPIVSSNELREIITKASKYVALPKDGLPNLEGLHLRSKDYGFRIEASDGICLYMSKVKASKGLAEDAYLPPFGLEGIMAAFKVRGLAKSPVRIYLDKDRGQNNWLTVALDNLSISTVDYVGNGYPDVDLIIPKENESMRMVVDSSKMKKAVKAAFEHADEERRAISFQVDDCKCLIRAGAKHEAMFELEQPYGDTRPIFVNAGLMLNAISIFGASEDIKITFRDKFSPIMFSLYEGTMKDDEVVLVMALDETKL